ncbi:integration host factor subunit alpha [Geomonas oryzae]|uniref:integration host factor subunit alpha n=1 Tax=Geomonas oryzae TaxID=2364273 RepID=UPI00100AF1CE|nr:integration host factor subunit alpha [Geomonas oryzae]
MTKAEIAERIARIGYTTKDSVELMEQVLDIVKETLITGEEVKIAGFGKFSVNEKAPRRGRNPQTGEEITLAERKVVSFKPSQILKEEVNR